MNSKLLAAGVASALALSVMATPAVAEQGKFFGHLRAIQIAPADKSDPIPALGAPADIINVSNKWAPDISIGYFLTDHVALDLLLTVPQSHTVSIENGAKLGTFKHLPPTLFAQYHFNPEGKFRPYIGAGLNYTMIMDVDLAVPGNPPTALDLSDNSFGPAAQIGFDLMMDEHWSLNLDVKKLWIDADVKAGSTKLTNVQVDPYLYGIGIGYRFGTKPPPPPVEAPPPPPPPPPPPADSDGDGVTDDIDACPNTPKGATVDAKGCPADGDGDGVLNGLDKCPTTPKGAKVDTDGCLIELAVGDVFFAFDKAKLNEEGTKLLDQVAADALSRPAEQRAPLTIEITGYTDSVGPDAYNLKLGERRAQAVADYLATKNLGFGKTSVLSKGEADPVADNKTKEGRAQNRRAVLRLFR